MLFSNMERLAPRSVLLVGKSTEVAKYAEQKARELLGRHPGLVITKVANLIAQREATLALQEYGKKRLDGYANDDYSQQPGLTAYLTPQSLKRVVKMCEQDGNRITNIQIEEVTINLIALRLPRGAYVMGGGGAQFYQEANTDWEQSHTADKPFLLDYNDVVRVEGDANELWQNINYQWDGTPKTIDKIFS